MDQEGSGPGARCDGNSAGWQAYRMWAEVGGNGCRHGGREAYYSPSLRRIPHRAVG